MSKKNQSGFSLIELLIVIVIIAIIASLAVPGLVKAKQVTENESARNTLRAMVSTQLSFYATNDRYASLGELNALSSNGFGRMSGNQLLRSKFTFEMIPSAPDNELLKSGYVITVVKDGGSETPYTLNVDESGRIVEPFSDSRK